MRRDGPPDRKRALVLAVALVLMALPALVGATPAPPVRGRDVQEAEVTRLLQAPHMRVSRQLLQRIGPNVGEILVNLATTSDTSPPLRVRAYAWLQFLPSPQVRAVLLQALGDPHADVAVLRVALRSMAYAFGSEALGQVRDGLVHRDVYVREAAAWALGDIRDPRVRGIAVDRLEREPQAAVRDALMTVIQRIDGRPEGR